MQQSPSRRQVRVRRAPPVSLTMEIVCFGLSGFGCLCPSGVKVEGREAIEIGTLGTVRRWGLGPGRWKGTGSGDSEERQMVKKEVNDLK